jgi:hypothetical protein
MANPRQTRLFDPYQPVLTAANQQGLEENWPGVFRHVILELMPVASLPAVSLDEQGLGVVA